MLLDDLLDVFLVDVGVPDAFGIDDDARALFAAIEAAGLVDAHVAGPRELELLHALLRVVAHAGGALVVAAGAIAGRALVAAEKDVIAVVAAHASWTFRLRITCAAAIVVPPMSSAPPTGDRRMKSPGSPP